MKNYDYFLFDWDGCLAKTLEVWLNAYKTAYAERGVHPSDIEIAHHLGDWAAPKHYGIKDVDACVDRVVEIAEDGLQEVDLYPDAKEFLQKLKATKKIALLSSSERRIINQGLKHNGLEDIFDVVITGDEVTDHKPHPEVIEKGLAALGGTKGKAIMIGDSRKDLGAAQNAGVDSMLIYHDSHDIFYELGELNKYKPTYTVNSFQQFSDLFDNA